MRVPLAITSIALCAVTGHVSAVPLRACATVAARVDEGVGPPLATLPEPQAIATQLRACLNSHNICGVVYDAHHAKPAVVAGDVTGDLPTADLSERGKPPTQFLVRSIPRVRNDANQYCLISERSAEATSVQQWDVYGWVVPARGGEPLPLPRQVLESKPVSDPRSLRGLAAALWSFAERMSGRPPPHEGGAQESPGGE